MQIYKVKVNVPDGLQRFFELYDSGCDLRRVNKCTKQKLKGGRCGIKLQE